MVFVLHTTDVFEGHYPYVERIISAGHLGVDLFFCLSGYLITRILFSAKGSSNYFSNFYMRRSLRIFPLYYAFVTGFYVLVFRLNIFGLGHDKLMHDAFDFRWLWFYGANIRIAMTGKFMSAMFNHFWTLSVEEHFYLFWPLLVFLLSTRRLLAAAIVIVVGALTLRTVLCLAGYPLAAMMCFTPCRVDAFAVAGAIGVAQLLPWRKNAAEEFARVATFPCLALGVGLFYADGIWRYTLGLSLATFGFSCLIMRASLPGRLNRCLSNVALRIVGKYSYALYVFHVPILRIFLKTIPISRLSGQTHSAVLAVLLEMLVVGVLSGAAAFLSWNLLERHFLAMKEFFPEPSSARPT